MQVPERKYFNHRAVIHICPFVIRDEACPRHPVALHTRFRPVALDLSVPYDMPEYVLKILLPRFDSDLGHEETRYRVRFAEPHHRSLVETASVLVNLLPSLGGG